LTGESAVFGEDIKDVLLFARDHFGDTNIQLDIQDDQCSGKGGAATSSYFVQQEVRAVLGFACVESIMPAIPVLQRAGIPVVSVLASGREITGDGRNVFNLYPSDDLGVKLIAQRLSKLKISRIMVLTADSAFPVGITEAFKRQPKEPGVDVTYKTYPAMTDDFASILSQLHSRRGSQAVFINYSSVSELIAFLKERERDSTSEPDTTITYATTG
jgi:branched-chain amino acid transport system substrate-binding protein